MIDSNIVIAGSFNWFFSAAHTNDETLLVIHSKQPAAYFNREMNRLWRGADFGPTERLRHKLESSRRRCGNVETAYWHIQGKR